MKIYFSKESSNLTIENQTYKPDFIWGNDATFKVGVNGKINANIVVGHLNYYIDDRWVEEEEFKQRLEMDRGTELEYFVLAIFVTIFIYMLTQ